MPLPITHVATTDISDMMSQTGERRMSLPGFDAEFVDFPHYIIRITERIWHDREVELCLKWYAEDCAIHTLAGDIAGAQTVVDNTWATLRAFPDRRLDGDNVIWSDNGGGAFHSSHLITSKMTNHGATEFGPATGKQVQVVTIADCLCQNNKVIEEWLVRDNLALVQQLGLDADKIAAEQARADLGDGFNLIDFHTANRAHVTSGVDAALTPAAEIAANMLKNVWQDKQLSDLADHYDYRVDSLYPGGVRGYGPSEVVGVLDPLLHAIPDAQIRIDHVADIAYLGDTRDVAIRWSLAGTHSGAGRYGAPTSAPIYILGVSHFRIMNGRIREERVVWDDLAVRRQVATARLLA